MLVSMQPLTSAAPAHPSRTFAGLLAGFVAAEKLPPPDQNLDDLDEDVASLSYEQALRTHTRFRPMVPSSEPGWDAAANVTMYASGDIAARTASGPPDAISPGDTKSPHQSGRRCSSITVRLSAEENEQLHLRAAEAKLTVSAYLRSCAFEVESLRAEVKATVAQMRSESAPNDGHGPSAKRPTLLRFFNRLSRRKPQS